MIQVNTDFFVDLAQVFLNVPLSALFFKLFEIAL